MFLQIYPEVTCPGANLIVMIQVICSNLIDFIMLGLVFARFSAPFKRATSIRFSNTCTINRHSSGYWALTLRWAVGVENCCPGGGGAGTNRRDVGVAGSWTCKDLLSAKP
jgi:hypothetical protein